MKERERIVIAGGKHTIGLDAEVYGAFAVHPPVGADPSYWRKRNGFFVVTHILTGYAVCDASKVNARQIANQLNATLPDGNFTVHDIKAKTEAYQAFVTKARPIVRELQS